MKLISVRFKNILSFGNTFTEIDFSSTDRILIQGTNGSGKSAALLDTIFFGLYGKPFRKIVKPKLVNYKNRKNLEVEVCFESDSGDFYKVKRGISPTIFEIYRNGVLIDQNSLSLDYQEYLEKDILKIDAQAFSQIILLGKATHVAFLKLNLDDRRQFIETILNLNIFTQMNNIAKSSISSIREKMNDLNSLLNLKEQQIVLQKKHKENMLYELRKQQSSYLQDLDCEIQKIEDEIKNIQIQIEEHLIEVNEITSDIDLLQKKLDSYKSLLVKFNVRIDDIVKKISFFETTNVCPMCDNIIDNFIKLNKTTDLENKKNELFLAQQQLEQKTSGLLNSVKDIELQIQHNNKISNKIKILENEVKQKEKQLQEIINKKSLIKINGTDENILKIDNELNISYNELEDINKQRISLQDDLSHYSYITMMLKDSGLKSNIIKMYIPIIKTLMEKYLKLLGINIRFELNENFKESLYSSGFEELQYNGYSEGEKLRIDLAMLMTWRETCNLLNKTTFNVLIIDEILDSSLDEVGINNLLTLFRSLKNDGIKVIVISHHIEQWDSNFDEILLIERKVGFSQIIKKETTN